MLGCDLLVVEINLSQTNFLGNRPFHKFMNDPSSSQLEAFQCQTNVMNDFPALANHRSVPIREDEVRAPQQISDCVSPVNHCIKAGDSKNHVPEFVNRDRPLFNSEYLSQGSPSYSHLRTFSFFACICSSSKFWCRLSKRASCFFCS